MQSRGQGFRGCAGLSFKVAVFGLLGGLLGGVGWAQTSLSAAWQPVGPAQVASQRYGSVTGRVTSIAVDPADTTGNTVYLGTTGGGVWKSTNAAGAAASVTFAPLTDALPVFSLNAGGAATPALSIGAVSVNGGVVLAGTGDPNDSLDSYYGEGILRSADGGVTWTLAIGSNDGVAGWHMFTGLAVAGLAWSTQTSGLVVAAVTQASEGVLVNAPNASSSVTGLYYSADSGATWKMATVKDGTAVVQQPTIGGAPGNAATAVIWNPVRKRFYAAVRFHGYYESVDGATWTRLANQPGTGLTMTACPTNPGLGGNTGCPMFRGSLAVDEATGDMYALTVDTSNTDQGLWRDVCGLNAGACTNAVAFGTRLDSTVLEVGSGSTAISQGDYNLSLAAVASGTDTLVFVGTTDLYRCSIASGCVLRNTTNAVNGCAAPAKVAPAQHALAAVAGAGTTGAPLILIGNDGGLWRSMDGVNQQQIPCSSDDATHFDNLNGGLGSLAEVVSFAQDPTDRGTLLVGLGANGTAATATGSGAWTQVSAGEGGTVAIDQTNPANWYVETAAGVSMKYCAKGNSCGAADFAGAPTLGYAQVRQDASAIHVPMLLDPALSSDVLVGTCRVWRGAAQSGANWPGSSAISAMLGGPQNTACSATTNPVVRSLAAGGPASGATAVQNAGSTVLYAGMAGRLDGGGNYGGHLFALYGAGTATSSTVWTDVGQSPVTNGITFNPGRFDVPSVVVDPHDATGKTVYATVAGFSGNGVNTGMVYRSTDGGAHWTNITSNLMYVPTNAIAVDPGDANTVYVAGDAGVYATQNVANCSAANCWTLYGTGLPNAPSVALQASAGMATGDGRTGELRVGTYGRGIWEIPLLTASGQVSPVMSLSPATLAFAAQQAGTLSPAQTVTVTNTGGAALTVSSVAVTGDFTESDTCAGGPIAVGAGCAVQVSFLPSATGTRTGLLTIYGNVSGGQATVSLSGTGTVSAAVVLSPVSVTFPATDIGASSAVQNITVSNTGGAVVTLQTPVATGDFAISANTCGSTLSPGVGCTVSVIFRPTVSGTQSGSFSVADSAGTQTAALSGTGLLPATDAVAPSALSFGPQVLSTASATQQVVLTNSGDTALQLIAAQITSGDFTVVNGCGNSLNGHASCALMVAFVPKSVGAQSGVMTVSDQYRSQTVGLSGTGVAPAGVSTSPVGGLAFTATGVGLSAAAQTVTLTNNGGVALAIQSVTATGDFAIVAGSNSCGGTVAVGSACAVQVVFAPTAAGVRSGTLAVADSGTGSPHTVALSGMGVDFVLAANGPVSQTIAAGGNATYGLLLKAAAGLPGTAAMACAGAPAYATCTVTPNGPAISGTTLVTVTIATTSAGMEMPMRPGERRGEVLLALVLPVGLLFARRIRMGRLTVLVLVCGAIGLGGCSASRLVPATSGSSGGGGGGATPKGTYNVTVSGASAGLTRSVGLTLVVQ
ncbi:MAG TPA: choice-of-anchor D domain-containing protein [Acidobacteriaceae bacterium]|nr:choice-of-anchor D domain-containing protein [Acidobacteriaceae bacterium]